MRLRHRLAALIWAAILLVAAQWVTAPAFAHPGHSHEHHASAARSSSVQDAHGYTASDAGSDQVHATQLRKLDLALGAVNAPEPAASIPSGGCTGGCCGTSMGCCGAALFASPNTLPDFRSATKIIAFVYERGSGIEPEASAPPPRSLA
jgi:hypothetical protein